MTLVAVGELRLAGGFQPVVELVRHAGSELVHQGLDVEVLEGELGEEAVEELGVVEVALDGAVDTRVLDLDRHRASVGHHGPVHLADGRGCHGDGVPVEEESLRVGAQLGAHHCLRQAGRHGRHVGLEGGQSGLGLGREALGDERQHLARLHDGALHAPENLGHVLGGTDGELLLQPGSLLGGGDPAADAHQRPVPSPADGQAPHPGLPLQAVATLLVTKGGRAHRPRGGRARQRGHPGQDQRLAHRMPSFGSGPLAGRARLALGDSLVTEAEPGRGQGLEAVVVDRLTTGLALPVAPVVEPRECVLDLTQLGFDPLQDRKITLAVEGLGPHIGLVLNHVGQLSEALVLRLLVQSLLLEGRAEALQPRPLFFEPHPGTVCLHERHGSCRRRDTARPTLDRPVCSTLEDDARSSSRGRPRHPRCAAREGL